MGGNFVRLWIGQGTSAFGTAISALAIPTVAIVTLGAPATAIGVLKAVQFAAFPIVGLLVGVWVDRRPKRSVMIAADAVRFLALASLPIGALLHRLTFAQLLAVAGIVGIASVFFDVAYGAFVPALVDASMLERANARLEATYTASRIAGNGLAGTMIAFLGAPLTIAIDALSYVASIAAVGTIRIAEGPASEAPRERFLPALRAGIRTITGSPVLAPLTVSLAFQNAGWAILLAVQLLFFYRTLHLSALLVGILFAFGNLGFAGALIAPAMSRRFGPGPVLFFTAAGMALAAALLPLAGIAPIPMIAASELLMAICGPAFNVVQVSLRQRLVAAELRGRMTATVRTLIWGVLPLGALAGGIIADCFGILTALIAGAALCAAALPWLLVRPIRTLPQQSVAA